MENTLAHKAVSLAISGDWSGALETNQQILSDSPNDTEALNRLARCFFELGKTGDALKTTQKVLELDPADSIAQKCLLRWKSVKPGQNRTGAPQTAELFLEDSGKTKIVPLLNLGSPDIFTSLDSGQEVKLSAYAHKVSVTDMDGKYIGRISDDLAARLRNLLKKGGKYQVLIKSIEPKNVSVFIRELENKTGVTSFPPEKIDYVSFTPPELVHKDAPVTAVTEETPE
jgi:tetratricopeptide (TPR) repeat protein